MSQLVLGCSQVFDTKNFESKIPQRPFDALYIEQTVKLAEKERARSPIEDNLKRSKREHNLSTSKGTHLVSL